MDPDNNLIRSMAEFCAKRYQYQERIFDVFEAVKSYYKDKGMILWSEISAENDVHVFFQLIKDPQIVVHVKGYSKKSSEDQMRLGARLIGYDLMWLYREMYNSVGGEYGAIIKELDGFRNGIDVPYDAKILEELLAKDVPELRV